MKVILIFRQWVYNTEVKNFAFRKKNRTNRKVHEDQKQQLVVMV